MQGQRPRLRVPAQSAQSALGPRLKPQESAAVVRPRQRRSGPVAPQPLAALRRSETTRLASARSCMTTTLARLKKLKSVALAQV